MSPLTGWIVFLALVIPLMIVICVSPWAVLKGGRTVVVLYVAAGLFGLAFVAYFVVSRILPAFGIWL